MNTEKINSEYHELKEDQYKNITYLNFERELALEQWKSSCIMNLRGRSIVEHNIYESQKGKPILTNEYEIAYINIPKEIHQADIKSKMKCIHRSK